MRFKVPVEFEVEADDAVEAADIISELLESNGINDSVESWNAKRDEGVDVEVTLRNNAGKRSKDLWSWSYG